MTAKEFKAALQTLAKEIGPRATLSAIIDGSGGENIYCGVYPRGPSQASFGLANKGYFSVSAEDFDGILAAVRAKWAEFAAEFAVQTLQKMALAIVRITDNHGSCTDAALREEFAQDEIDQFGQEACRKADAMADKGPFSITTMAGANGAPDVVKPSPEGAAVH